MRAIVIGLGVAAFIVAVEAQPKPDPRVGLKPGLHDAGVAASNMELVSNMPASSIRSNPQANRTSRRRILDVTARIPTRPPSRS
jgi:hypothetical protein